MLSTENLSKFIEQTQTSKENVVREYCQHVLLSYLYQQPGAERLLFKGGTALRMVFQSPRYSEDLDFTGIHISQTEVENIFTDTLAHVEHVGIHVALEEAKFTTGGYLGIAIFHTYGLSIPVRIEVSLRNDKNLGGTRSLVHNEYIPPYTLVHLVKEKIIQGKMQALLNRHKPRDFYDYFFLLSGNYPIVKERGNLEQVLTLLQKTKIDFRSEIKELLPKSHAMHLRNFKKILEEKIAEFL